MKRWLAWKFDMLIYRLFRWRWNDRLKDPLLRQMFRNAFDNFDNTHP